MHPYLVFALAVLGCSGSPPSPGSGAPEPDERPADDAACRGDACVAEFRALLRKSPPDYPSADRFASAACDRGVEVMCARVGRIHALPLYPGSEPARGLAAFETSCKRGHQRGCLGVGKIIMVYPKLGARAGGSERARELFARSCEAGVGQGCYYLGMLHFLGRGVDKNPERAIELLTKRGELLAAACDSGEESDCGILAEAYNRGEIPVDGKLARTPDPGSAARYARRGCDAGDGDSCLILGRLTLERDRARAVDLFAKGCELLEPDACTELGRYGASEAEKPRLFRRACQLGGGGGCFALAEATKQGGDDPRARAAARARQARGCELGYPPSCRYHANMVRFGHGGAADPAAARSELLRVCQMVNTGTFCANARCVLAISSSCADAAEMFASGEGGPADPERAARLFKIACDRGLEKACAAAKPAE